MTSASILTRQDFSQLFDENSEGDQLYIFKFSAVWCKPCKKIAPYIESKLQNINNNITFYNIDIEDAFDLYSYLKKMKVVTGIPALYLYKNNNSMLSPEYSVSGTEKSEIDKLFEMANKLSS